MKLFYRTLGEGQPIIILHGLFGQSDNWQTLAKKIVEHNFKVITVDQRNHGMSPHDAQWNYSVMQADLLELIQDLDLQHPILIGHSMGGKTAMEFVANHSELLKKLIVVDIGPKKYPVHHGQIIEALKSIDLSTNLTRKEAEEILANRELDFGTRQFLLKNLYWHYEQLKWRFNLDVIANKIENVGVENDLEKIINLETHFIRGANSSYILDSDWNDISLKFPNSRLHTISNAGHWVNAEQPELFYELVLKIANNQ